MINTKTDKIKDAEAAFSGVVQSIFDSYKSESVYSKLANVVKVETSSIIMPFSYPVGEMEEWSGPKTMESLDMGSLTVKVRDFQKTISVDTRDLEDDTLGIYQNEIEKIGNVAAKYYDKLITDIIKANSTNTITGQAIFSDSQTWAGRATAQDNNLALALSEDNLITALTAMSSFKSVKGDILGVKPATLVVPPQLYFTAQKLVAPINSSGGYNALAGMVDVVKLDGLSNAAATWYLFDTVTGKPITILERQTPVVTSQNDSWHSHSVKFSVEMRAEAVMPVWSSCLRSVG